MPALAFERATRQNKPTLNPGNLVYARVSFAHRDFEPEIECLEPKSGKSKGYGELKNGYLVKCSLRLSRELLVDSSGVLAAVGRYFSFDSAVGVNGRVWILTEKVKTTLLLEKAIKKSEFTPKEGIDEMVKNLALEI